MKKRILIVGRVKEKEKKLIKRLIDEGHEVIHANKKQDLDHVKYMRLDIHHMKSVKMFLKRFHKSYAYLDVLLILEPDLPDHNMITEEGYDHLMAAHYLGPFMLTEGLKGSLILEEHARIIFVNATAAFKGNLVDFSHLSDKQTGYANAKRALLMYAVNLSDKLKNDHVTVNSISEAEIETGLIKRLFKTKETGHTDEDLYYLIMSEDMRYKTSKFFSGPQIMVIPQDKVLKEDINKLVSNTKKILRL